jgi:mRNA-degrading endonuclease RelE of RelBE toxin-antitoxin system
VRSHRSERFDRALERLPEQVKRQAREAYRLFVSNPYHPSLRFKRVHPSAPIYSARVNDDYRVLGRRDGDDIVWFWIGTRAEYDHLTARR